MDVDLLLCLW